MTNIHGEITRVYEVETRGYNLPNIQTTGLDHTGEWVPTLTYWTFQIVPNINNGLMKTLSVTEHNTTNLNEFFLTEIDASGTATIFSRGMFYINFKINLNDYPINNTSTYTITFGNYSGGWLYFTANLSYIEIQ